MQKKRIANCVVLCDNTAWVVFYNLRGRTFLCNRTSLMFCSLLSRNSHVFDFGQKCSLITVSHKTQTHLPIWLLVFLMTSTVMMLCVGHVTAAPDNEVTYETFWLSCIFYNAALFVWKTHHCYFTIVTTL